MMEVKQINQLMLAMGRTGIKKLAIKREGFELELEREEKAPIRGLDALGDAFEENPMSTDFEKHRQTAALPAAFREKITSKEGDGAVASKDDANSVYVTSPMVGTIYYFPSPNDPSFVKVGDRVEKNTIVCIIEAMKVMNEIKAQIAGTVAELLVENGSPVEFGTKIIRIIPV